MPSRAQHVEPSASKPVSQAVQSGGPDDYPVRDYIGAMSAELARMARWDGDEALAHLLEAAVRMCEQPAPSPSPTVREEAKHSGRG